MPTGDDFINYGGNMSELEAWNWLKGHYGYNLKKQGDNYTLYVLGIGESYGLSVIDCVLEMIELTSV